MTKNCPETLFWGVTGYKIFAFSALSFYNL